MPVILQKRLLNDKDSAAYLGICRTKFHSLVRNGFIKGVHIDSSVRYDVDDLDKFVEELKRRSRVKTIR